MYDMSNRIGMCAHLPTRDVLKKIVNTGIINIRCDFNWPSIEPQKGEWDFTRTDELVEFCDLEGINIFATLAYTPRWVQIQNAGLIAKFGLSYPRDYIPPTANDWETFVDTTVLRYKDSIKYWGAWNEPNTEHFTGGIDDYLTIVFLPMSKAIRLIDKKLRIVAPEIATSSWTNWVEWLERLSPYSYYYDVLSIHSYAPTAGRLIDYLERGKWKARLSWLRSLLDIFWPNKQAIIKKIRDIGKEVWLSEVGWSTHKVKELEQREYYRTLIRYIESQDLIKRVFFYEMIDDPHTIKMFGILRADKTHKPTYNYLRTCLRGNGI